MKQILVLVCGCCLCVSGFGQPTALSISKQKTTSLIFPFTILHVDRGTKDLLVQPVKEAGNILLVKAGVENFAETNLSVITDDGSIYSFVVNYDKKPLILVYHMPTNGKETLSTYANGILDNSRTVHGLSDKSWNMIARITGIYIKENVIYYQFKLINNSSIDYDIELLRFYIRDKKKGNRSATQENELKPLYIAGNISQVKGNSQNVVVVALEKFTIPDAKFLAIQVIEKNGGRHLLLKVNNNKIVKASVLPDLR
jgi:conjugative transposon TraN protein